jgi:hypothetical protein
MSKFNNKIQYERVSSYEGGKNYKKNPVEDLMNFMLSSYLEDRFYESAQTQQERFLSLLDEVENKLSCEWIAKLSFFARNEVGLRSIAELTAAWLNDKKFDNKRAYFRNFFHRPDDVGEVFAAIDMLSGKRSHALIRGAGDYLSSLKEYQLGKYKMNRKDWSMVDLINVTHAHSAAIDKLKSDTLETPETWETKISASKSEEEKADSWRELVEKDKLGYLALIRNLRNILNSNVDIEWVKTYLIPKITDENRIKKSLVFPYQIYCAWKNKDVNNYDLNSAMEIAFRLSCGNMPKLEGKNLVVLDVSGSMESRMSAKSNLTIKEVGAVYGAALLVNSNADFIRFGNYAKESKYNPLQNIFDIILDMQRNYSCGFGTDISPVFDLIQDRVYDRIFLISDMQIMDYQDYYWSSWNDDDAVARFNDYKRASGADPVLYSFDLGNYKNQIENPNNPKIHLMTSLSDQFFRMIQYIEDGGKLVDYIDKNYSYC